MDEPRGFMGRLTTGLHQTATEIHWQETNARAVAKKMESQATTSTGRYCPKCGQAIHEIYSAKNGPANTLWDASQGRAAALAASSSGTTIQPPKQGWPPSQRGRGEQGGGGGGGGGSRRLRRRAQQPRQVQVLERASGRQVDPRRHQAWRGWRRHLQPPPAARQRPCHAGASAWELQPQVARRQHSAKRLGREASRPRVLRWQPQACWPQLSRRHGPSPLATPKCHAFAKTTAACQWAPEWGHWQGDSDSSPPASNNLLTSIECDAACALQTSE